MKNANFLSRRSFLSAASLFTAAGGCRSLGFLGGRPRLSFGVVSDIHITTPESAAEFARALEYFRDRKADAVVVCGDLTDWGLLSGLKNVATAWNRVFPNDRAPDGRPVQKLFVTGNHDYEGWWYGDMTMEMHALGYSEDEALVRLGLKTCWEEVFQEAWAPIRRRTVNGYDFVSGEWHGPDKAPGFNTLPTWLADNAGKLDATRPFFYFQHPPIANTTGDSRRGWGTYQEDGVRRALAACPNAVSFTGHCHWTFNDVRSIWQDEFTALATPSMSYTTIPRGYENGTDVRNGASHLAMPKIASRPNLEEAQGYFVSVYDTHMLVERRDFEQGQNVAPWLVPLPTQAEKPFAFKATEAREIVPQFPAGAALKTYTRNTDTRGNKWAIVMNFEFPAAKGRDWRAFDYEVRAVLADGTVALMKRFLSPAFHKLAHDEPNLMRFWCNVDELPQDMPYHFEVFPRNCFGHCGRPLVSGERRSKPGLGKAKRG